MKSVLALVHSKDGGAQRLAVRDGSALEILRSSGKTEHPFQQFRKAACGIPAVQHNTNAWFPHLRKGYKATHLPLASLNSALLSKIKTALGSDDAGSTALAPIPESEPHWSGQPQSGRILDFPLPPSNSRLSSPVPLGRKLDVPTTSSEESGLI